MRDPGVSTWMTMAIPMHWEGSNPWHLRNLIAVHLPTEVHQVAPGVTSQWHSPLIIYHHATTTNLQNLSSEESVSIIFPHHAVVGYRLHTPSNIFLPMDKTMEFSIEKDMKSSRIPACCLPPRPRLQNIPGRELTWAAGGSSFSTKPGGFRLTIDRYIYIYTYIYMYIYMYIYICICIRTYTCMYVCIMYVCMYVCMYGWMYVWMDGWTDGCVYVCVYVCIYIIIYIMWATQKM